MTASRSFPAWLVIRTSPGVHAERNNANDDDQKVQPADTQRVSPTGAE
jgi:hypothetical protein